jgi:hypothetical protein
MIADDHSHDGGIRVTEQSRGERLREEIAKQYDVEGIAANALIDAIVATADELQQLEDNVAANGVQIDGARGQKVANPSLAALVKHRTLLARLLAEAFPGELETASQAAARAARTRWARQKGAT